MASLTLAVAQVALTAETGIDSLASHLRTFATEAAARQADVLVFPELVTTGLLAAAPDGPPTVATVSPAYQDFLPSLTDEFIDVLRELATSTGMTVVGGSHYRRAADRSLRNTSYVVHPDGRIQTQDKLHLTPPEHDLGAVGGDDVLVTRIGPFTAAVQICADIEFPEVCRYLVDQGVDLVFAPSLTWNRRGAQRVRYGAHARAMENQLYVAVSPLVGSSGLPVDAPLHGTGHAVVAGPIDRTVGANDGVLARGEDGVESLVVTTLDHDLLQRSRRAPEVPGLLLRRPDLYRELADRSRTRV